MQFIGRKLLNFGNENTLPVWQKIWGILFMLSFSSYIITNFVSNWSFWNNMHASYISLFILLTISFWDVVLFIFKSFKSMRKMIRFVVIDEKVQELNSIKNYSRSMIFILFINLALVLLAISGEVANQVASWNDSFATSMKSNTSKIVLTSLIGFFGFLSLFLKMTFMKTWNSFSCTHVHKKICYFMEGKIGASKIWIFNFSSILFILSGVLGSLLGLFFWKKDLVSFLGSSEGKLKVNEWFWQASACTLALIIFIILSNIAIYMVKDEKFLNYNMKRHGLSSRNICDLVRAKRNLNEVKWCNTWLTFLWLLSVVSLIMITEGIQEGEIQNIFKYVLICSLSVMCLTLPMMFMMQKSVRKNLNKCLHLMDDNNKDFSNLSFLH